MVERDFSISEMQFVQEVAKELQERMGQGYSIELRQMEMTTKPPYYGACVSVPGTNVSPVFHADEWLTMARQGKSQDEIVNVMEGRILEAERGMVGLPRMDFSKESILASVRYSIGSMDKHGDILGQVPTVRIENTDLFLYPVGQVEGVGTFSLRNEQLDAVGITDDEILTACQIRLDSEKAMVRPMGDVLSALTGREPEDYPNPAMLVITNEASFDGAVLAARDDVLELTREMLGCEEIMVLPSSRHELLAIPADLTSARDAEAMVTEINRTQVADQDVLSDHVYQYDGQALSRIETETRNRAKSR